MPVKQMPVSEADVIRYMDGMVQKMDGWEYLGQWQHRCLVWVNDGEGLRYYPIAPKDYYEATA